MKIRMKCWAFLGCVLGSYALGGCGVREDRDMCNDYALRVKVVDVDGNDITTSGAVASIDLYLFDENGFVRKLPAGASTDMLFSSDKARQLTVVAWGNLKDDSLKLPELRQGMPPAESKVEARERANGYGMSPTDLFYCKQQPGEVGAGSGGNTRAVGDNVLVLVMERCASSVSIRTNKFSSRWGSAGTDCYFVVQSSTNALNFLGEPVGDRVEYRPRVRVTDKGDLQSYSFRLLPNESSSTLCVLLCRGNETLCTVTHDKDGKPLVAPPGQQLNLLLDFQSADAQLSVSVTLRSWEGETNQDTQI